MGRKALVLMAALVLTVSGCSYKTMGAPGGGVTLTATFDDAQGLVAGHSVKMSDLTIGSVKKVELDGYRAKATLSIKKEYRIPQGTRAEIKVTSLLGENYVDLLMPPGGSMDRGPYLANRAAIADTSVQPAFEQVIGQTGPLLKALAGDDIATVVNAGATALDGNGKKLNTAIAKTNDLLKIFADQRGELGRAVDNFATLGRSLAKGGDELDEAPVQLQRTTRVLNDNKNKILKTVERLTRMAAELNDKVLEGRITRFRNLLRDLDPVLAQLGGNRKRLTDLVNGLVKFEDKLPRASYDGQLLLYPILRVVWPDGTPLIPGLGGNNPKAGKGGNAKGQGGRQGGGAAPKGPRLPKDLRGALPDLDKFWERQR